MFQIIKRFWSVSFALFVFFAVPIQVSQSAERLTLGTTEEPPIFSKDGTGFYNQVFAEACQRVGCVGQVAFVPAHRAFSNARTGIDDGLMAWVSGFDKTYPEIVPIMEPVLVRDFVAFTTRDDVRVHGWDSLMNLNVGIVRGFKILENNIKNSKSLIKVRDANSLFLMLKSGRVDVVVYGRIAGQYLAKQNGLKNVKALEPAFASKNMHIYLNKKWLNFVPKLQKAILDMKADGSFDAIYGRTISKALE